MSPHFSTNYDVSNWARSLTFRAVAMNEERPLSGLVGLVDEALALMVDEGATPLDHEATRELVASMFLKLAADGRADAPPAPLTDVEAEAAAKHHLVMADVALAHLLHKGKALSVGVAS